MITGALPPSSSDSFLTVEADCFIKILPTSVDPVKDNFAIAGCVVKTCPTSAACIVGNTLNTPAGKPASAASFANAKAHSGVSSAGFKTTVQPAANAGAILRVIIAIGKFQGVIAATTPIGCLIVMSRLSIAGDGIVSPYVRRHSSANHSIKDAPYATSPLASAKGFPCS